MRGGRRGEGRGESKQGSWGRSVNTYMHIAHFWQFFLCNIDLLKIIAKNSTLKCEPIHYCKSFGVKAEQKFPPLALTG